MDQQRERKGEGRGPAARGVARRREGVAVDPQGGENGEGRGSAARGVVKHLGGGAERDLDSAARGVASR